MKFDIKNRITGSVQFTAEIDCADDATAGEKLGLAVIAAVNSGADLSDANLRSANLRSADLRSADLSGAYLRSADLSGAYAIHSGTRSDGYEFYAHVRNCELWIKAGCRYFTIFDARNHWKKTRAGTALGEESFALLDNAERLAKIRGML